MVCRRERSRPFETCSAAATGLRAPGRSTTTPTTPCSSAAGAADLLSTVYVEVTRRAGIALAGVGLPGHYVAGHFGQVPPLLLDPFGGGVPLELIAPAELRAWGPHETALRSLNNLVGSYRRRADLARAIRAAELCLDLPLGESEREAFGTELPSLRARLN